MIGAIAPLVVLGALSATAPAPPPETGVSALADRLAAAIASRFASPEGRVLKVADHRVVLDLGELAPGIELEWLALDQDLLDPDSLERLGRLLRPCGRLKVVATGHAGSTAEVLAASGCPHPTPGDVVRLPAGGVRVHLEGGTSDRTLSGLLDVLIAILPDRLERSGRFTVDRRPARLGRALATRDPAELKASLQGAGLDAAVVVHVAARGQRIEALAEIVAIAPRPLNDVAQVEAEAVPAAIWRPERDRPTAERERAQIEIPGEVLALLARREPPGAAESVLVLTGEALFAVSLRPDDTLAIVALEDLGRLARAVSPTRVRAGSLALDGGGALARVCFATTELALGWCRGPSGLEPVDGVPVNGPAGLLLARYRPGTDLLDGELRAPGGVRVADIKPFLAVASAADGSILVERPEARVEWLGPDLVPSGRHFDACGDGLATAAGGRLLCSGPAPRGERDEVVDTAGGTVFAVGGAVAALARADLDGDGSSELVAATVGGGRSQLLVFRPAQ